MWCAILMSDAPNTETRAEEARGAGSSRLKSLDQPVAFTKDCSLFILLEIKIKLEQGNYKGSVWGFHSSSHDFDNANCRYSVYICTHLA